MRQCSSTACTRWIAEEATLCDTHAIEARYPAWSDVKAQQEEPAPAPAPEGFKLDTGKRLWRLVPWDAMGPVVDVLTWACKRTDPKPYPEHNWRKVDGAVDRYHDALMRHVTAWQMHHQGLEGGSEVDEQSGIHHLAHAACNALFLVALVVCQKTDRRK